MSLNCGKKVGAAGGERSTVEESDEMFPLDEEKLHGFSGERQNVWRNTDQMAIQLTAGRLDLRTTKRSDGQSSHSAGLCPCGRGGDYLLLIVFI